MFRGCTPPLHSGVYVSGHFNNLAAVAFLPPPRSPAKSMREPRSPPLLNHWIDEVTPPISLFGEVHPLNTYKNCTCSLYMQKRTEYGRTRMWQTVGNMSDVRGWCIFLWIKRYWALCFTGRNHGDSKQRHWGRSRASAFKFSKTPCFLQVLWMLLPGTEKPQ